MLIVLGQPNILARLSILFLCTGNRPEAITVIFLRQSLLQVPGQKLQHAAAEISL